jgi:hypothetical protein
MTPILMVQWAFWGMLSLILLGIGVAIFETLVIAGMTTRRRVGTVVNVHHSALDK